uniref:Uncharacterized protein n=1 Tax=Myoviridae sp. ctBZY1 TaxID=2825046 RepID=A0A8S5V8D1_9CAUD|nr:MAG TPA: hypothetical protein [Myoviridae sp. ctBZY1]
MDLLNVKLRSVPLTKDLVSMRSVQNWTHRSLFQKWNKGAQI